MTSPGNQHCASCIGTLLFPMCKHNVIHKTGSTQRIARRLSRSEQRPYRKTLVKLGGVVQRIFWRTDAQTNT